MQRCVAESYLSQVLWCCLSIILGLRPSIPLARPLLQSFVNSVCAAVSFHCPLQPPLTLPNRLVVSSNTERGTTRPSTKLQIVFRLLFFDTVRSTPSIGSVTVSPFFTYWFSDLPSLVIYDYVGWTTSRLRGGYTRLFIFGNS